jgi:hypothetical protein
MAQASGPGDEDPLDLTPEIGKVELEHIVVVIVAWNRAVADDGLHHVHALLPVYRSSITILDLTIPPPKGRSRRGATSKASRHSARHVQ